MLEPTVTPTAAVTPIYWVDQVDIAVELPMGPPGVQGAPGSEWIVGPGVDPPASGDFDDGTLFLASDGKIYRYDKEAGVWVYTEVDLLPSSGTGIPAHDHPEYLELAGGAMTGPLSGTDATFTGNVVVPTPDAPTEAVNVEYLNNLGLEKFLGDVSGNAIVTGVGGWAGGQGQAIYQNGNVVDVPPGVTGPTVGLTMRQSNGNITQLICEVGRNVWFTRTQVVGTFGPWSTLTPIVSTAAPVDGPLAAPHGTIWIQTDGSVTP